MKPEYDLANMKSRPNPFAKQLKQQVTLPLGIDVIEYFEDMAQEKGISYQELISCNRSGGGCQAASGIDSVEELSWGRREGEELP